MNASLSVCALAVVAHNASAMTDTIRTIADLLFCKMKFIAIEET
jgi:hypothetical protein